MFSFRIIISGGGTGGHIFPAISIAETILKRFPGSEILFVGAENRMEMERVPAAGYQIIGLPVSGFNRSNLFQNIRVLSRLLKSIRMAKKIIRDFKPDAVIGVGGYASGPTLWAAGSLKIPCLIQEQNSYAGVTNKLLGKRVAKICVAYEGMERFFPAGKIILAGNPVRKDLEDCKIEKDKALAWFNLQPGRKTVLIVGGSLGARTINDGIYAGLDQLLDADIQVIWQTGRVYYDTIMQSLRHYELRGTKQEAIHDDLNELVTNPPQTINNDLQIADPTQTTNNDLQVSNPPLPANNGLWVSDFISRMDYAYTAADLVVSRAGAGSISELCILKKPVILVPSPNVAEDHQTKNALAIVNGNAAVMIADKDAESQLANTIINLIHNTEQLGLLSENIGKMARHQSAERIVSEIVKIIKKGH